ncbi:hypothetical protein G9F73_002225 [Clostridium estertheticum]|uniref:hypothetical protein n=1 Tax=Clostridium estertheticum TaxID=238834 RepID=UPI0013EE54C9|nr:hypothetical protein [Clostridium estertheticum]MBZ9606655.1 hypothetical protein [Clostridium estertheticum]
MNQKNCKDRYETLSKTVDIPIELYESMRGQYFIGYADDCAPRKRGNQLARVD